MKRNSKVIHTHTHTDTYMRTSKKKKIPLAKLMDIGYHRQVMF